MNAFSVSLFVFLNLIISLCLGAQSRIVTLEGELIDGNIKGIPVLSVVGLLNDNYEGGDFVMFEDYKVSLKKGDVLVFPSNFLYPHKVTPVKKGTRYSFVSWVW